MHTDECKQKMKLIDSPFVCLETSFMIFKLSDDEGHRKDAKNKCVEMKILEDAKERKERERNIRVFHQ